MRRAFHLMAVALTLATSALLAPVAHADPAPPQLPSQPPSFFFLPSGTNYKYYDNDGWGTLNVTNAGYGYGTGVQLIKVQLKQNGNTFYGSGVSYGGLLVFTLSDYVFQVYPTGWGSYFPSGNPYNQYWCWVEYP